MASLKEHLERASWGGFDVESIEILLKQSRELVRLVGRKEYREAGSLASSMGARCDGISGQCFRHDGRERGKA